MLKEAIAEAKTIKETAIANAKAALEEAFTPQLTAMFAEKLNELEEGDDVKEEMYDENYGVDEDFNLEEILAELDKVDEYAEEQPNRDIDGDGDVDADDVKMMKEDLMLEEMSDEELEDLILKVLRQEIEAGNVEAGENFEEEETDIEDMDDMGDMEDEEEVEDEEVELDELLAEIEEMEKEKEVEEGYEAGTGVDIALKIADMLNISPEQVNMIAAALPVAAIGGMFLAPKVKELFQKLKAKIGDKKVAETADTTEMEETIAELRSELNEVNLLNAKLLYTNKIFKAKNLTESEKVKVLNTFDKAETVKEVKLVFETLTESLKALSIAKKNTIKESLGSASKTISAPVETKQPIIEVNDAFARMRILAGLK